MAQKIGFVGVGMMGHGMAKNLLKKGYDVTVMAHKNRKPIEDLVAQGAKEAKTPSDVTAAIRCRHSVRDRGSAGGAGGLRQRRPSRRFPARAWCSSTARRASPRRASASPRTSAQKADYVDAPLARSPAEAEAGKLNTMVGADEKVFGEIRPILETFCENIFYMGGVGSGARTKLIYNLITMGHAALIAEALCACAATGVDLARFAKVVGAGGANSGIFQLIVPKILEQDDYSGLKFSLANAAKDLRYYNRMISDVPLSAAHGARRAQRVGAGHQHGFRGWPGRRNGGRALQGERRHLKR